jgi:hypothetical protein
MTRTSQILALLASLVALAATAPTASAATSPNPRVSADPAGIRHGSLDPKGIRWGSRDPNPRGYVTPNPRLAPNPLKWGKLAPAGYRFR